MTASKPSNVVEALAAVMAELPAIGKDSKAAPQQGGYAYRGIEAITQVVQPLFAKHGIVFAARVESYEIRELVVNGKPWTDTVALIAYDVYGPGGVEDRITVGPFVAIGRDNSDKGGNKCATQAFKYALIQTLCISDAKDDSDHGSPEADTRAPAEPPSPPDPEADRLRGVLRESVKTGVVTAEQANDAATKHGVGTGDALARASAAVLASVLDTLGITDGEKVNA